MNKKQLQRDISIHYNDGIAMNDHETAIENILLSVSEFIKFEIIRQTEKTKYKLNNKKK